MQIYRQEFMQSQFKQKTNSAESTTATQYWKSFRASKAQKRATNTHKVATGIGGIYTGDLYQFLAANSYRCSNTPFPSLGHHVS